MIIRHNRKMRLAILVAAGAALTSLLAGELLPSRGKPPAPGAEWVEIGVATDGTRAFVNRHSIVDAGARVTLWQRFTLGSVKPHTGAAGTVDQLVIYDCEDRDVTTLESRELGAAGAVLRSQKFLPPVRDTIRVGSLPEFIHDAVC